MRYQGRGSESAVGALYGNGNTTAHMRELRQLQYKRVLLSQVDEADGIGKHMPTMEVEKIDVQLGRLQAELREYERVSVHRIEKMRNRVARIENLIKDAKSKKD